MSRAAAPLHGGLLFDWQPDRRGKLVIASFIVLSAVLHAFGFYLFQISHPPAVGLLPPPARVALIRPEADEGRALLNWIEAEDPALVSTTQPPPDSKLLAPPKLRHIPSYAGEPAALPMVPDPAPDLRVPSIAAPAPVRTATLVRPRPSARVATQLIISAELQPRQTATLPKIDFRASGSEAPENSEFLIAVTPAGVVQYCLPRRTSGDPALDRQAAAYLARCRFAPVAASENLIWSNVTFAWGNNLAPPPSPAPPP